MNNLGVFLRSLKCQHDWETIANWHDVETDDGHYSQRIYRCKKCGYVQIVKN